MMLMVITTMTFGNAMAMILILEHARDNVGNHDHLQNVDSYDDVDDGDDVDDNYNDSDDDQDDHNYNYHKDYI